MRVLVTGANKGLGLEWVRQLCEKKYKVLATYRSIKGPNDPLARMAENYPENLLLVPCDLRKDNDILALARTIHGSGKLDRVIQNSGIYGDPQRQSLESLDRNTLLETFNVNAASQIIMANALLPLVNSGGIFCFVTSKMGSIADNQSGGSYPYRASKTALNMLQMSFSHDSVLKGVYSLCMHPGWVRTDMGGHNAPTDVIESVSGMMKVLEGFLPEMHGGFFDFKGLRIPW